uniref:Reverse transcriptase n=2 Tax=Chironomus tentans TaxID=7153 RepID=V9H092_CHITE|nr:reverse transcriptase [Chironomus tentans]
MDCNQQINVLYWNANGLTDKMLAFLDYLSTQKVDVACISETFLKPNSKIDSHPDYVIHRFDRVDRPKGGVAIIVKRNLKHQLQPSYNTKLMECIGIKVFITDSVSCHILSVYLPGGSKGKEIDQHLRDDINKITNIRGNYYICGDFNAKHREWNCNVANKAGTILQDMSGEFMIYYPDSPTYYPEDPKKSESTIDLMLSNSNLETTELNCTEAMSDHCAVYFQIKTSKIDRTENTVYRYDYKNANWKKFKTYISRRIEENIGENTCNSVEEIENHIKTLSELIIEARNSSVKKKKINFESTKLTPEIKDLIKTKRTLRRRWQHSRENQIKTELNYLQKVINEKIKELKNINWNKRLSEIKTSNQTVWRIAKLCKKGSKSMPPLTSSGKIYITNKEKASVLSEHFREAHENPLEQNNIQHTQEVNNTVKEALKQDNEDDPELTDVNEIVSIIRNLKNPKSPGLDDVNNILIKNLPPKGFEYLKFIINSCLKLNHFPKVWKHAKVIPIPKPGKPTNEVSSYRPISLVSSISKILERILLNRINDHLEDNNIIPNQQCGFRTGRSTSHQLIKVIKTAKENINNKKSTGMIFLDVEKAFDRVWHNGLLYKMLKLRFPLPLIKTVRSFLSERTFSVFIKGQFSEIKEIKYGVPQGAVLSPTLYNIFTYDIVRETTNNIALFADDTALYHSAENSADIVTQLLHTGRKVQQYMDKWKINLNKQKSQAIFITNRYSKQLPRNNIKFLNENIKWESEANIWEW